MLAALIVLIAVFSNLGIYFLGLISYAISEIFSKYVGKIPIRFFFLKDLTEPLAKVAFRRLKNNLSFYTEFFKLRNLSNNPSQEKNSINKFTEQVFTHASSVTDPHEAIALNYYCALSQDQRSLDLNADELQALWNLLTISFVAIPATIILDLNKTNTAIMIILIMILILFTVKTLVRRKRFFAVLLISSYLDNFALGPPAEISDREGEAIL